MSLTVYAKRLASGVRSGGKAAFDNLCFDIEYDQLTKDNWDLELFNFFLDLLRDPVICGLSGSEAFVRTLYHDIDKIKSEYQKVLLEVFDQEADNFGDEMLRHSVSDMVARKYQPLVALKLFDKWMRRATPNRLHMAEVGFEVLIMARKLGADEEPKVRQRLDALRRKV